MAALVQLKVTPTFFKALLLLPKEVAQRTVEALQKFMAEPKAPALHYEPLQQMRDPRVRTIRANQQYRIVLVAPEKGSLHHVVHVDNHDEAMAWAERKRFTFDENEGLSMADEREWQQLVGAFTSESPAPEGQMEAASPSNPSPQGPWANLDEGSAKRLGIPLFLLPSLRAMPNDNAILDAVGTLSEEIIEALMALAEGQSVDEVLAARDAKQAVAWAQEVAQKNRDAAASSPLAAGASEAHPVEAPALPMAAGGWLVQAPSELLALMDNWTQWQIYLHPSQQRLVDQNWSGPARVLGGAGTGKTVVLLHRAVRLAKALASGQKLLITTFNKSLAASLQRTMLDWQAELSPRMHVSTLHTLATRTLHQANHPLAKLRAVNLDDEESQGCLRRAQEKVLDEPIFPLPFLTEEYAQVIAAQGIRTAAEYLNAPRVGRGKALSRGQRQELWLVVAAFHEQLQARERCTWAQVFLAAAEVAQEQPPFQHVLVDEAQDLDGAAYSFVRALAPRQSNDVFLVGDGYQRIYPVRVSLERVGLPVRGRSALLKLNYRTTEDIRRWAVARVEGVNPDAKDGDSQNLKGYRSLLRGPQPCAQALPSAHEEREWVVARLKALGEALLREGVVVAAHHRRTMEDWGVFLRQSGLPVAGNADDAGIQVRTMHDMKGLEFKQVFLVGVTAREFPGPKEEDPTSSDRQRALLYVAATRARDALTVSCWGQPSPLVAGWQVAQTVKL